MKRSITIVQPAPPAEETPVEVIVTSILKLSEAMQELSRSRLTRRAIVTLIQAESKLAKRDIELVLNNLESLEKTWLKPAPKKS
jgi:hypothetical protein